MAGRKGDGSRKTARRVLWAALACGLCAVLYLLPPFRIVPLERAHERATAAAFQAEEFARTFWTERLLPSADRATEASVLLKAIHADPRLAREEHSRSVGLGNVYYYYLAGEGEVRSVGPRAVELSVSSDGPGPDLVLLTAGIFGNTIRDSTGLLEMSDFPNSQDYNAISSVFNRIVETEVVPAFLEKLEKAAAGSSVRFLGCAEIVDEREDLQPLRVIPIALDVQRK